MAASDTVEAIKRRGNELFKKGKLGPAIDAYTEAIVRVCACGWWLVCWHRPTALFFWGVLVLCNMVL